MLIAKKMIWNDVYKHYEVKKTNVRSNDVFDLLFIFNLISISRFCLLFANKTSSLQMKNLFLIIENLLVLLSDITIEKYFSSSARRTILKLWHDQHKEVDILLLRRSRYHLYLKRFPVISAHRICW